eukprot:CAMPEP_0204633536 /NCGR_PEP_ID=MMETSP0717-20131115/27431_1 /ASSEMBLY_ACC=CAM_ASM_000666 /TAXON_ID=230516 /ORGANISM="Chaetoceros curvisetus" /LENGTH=145 /DNA_ID=CAMNT_0051651735 /DNA_START=66 /DNA_END=504 /DNA_ORIENTATION=+
MTYPDKCFSHPNYLWLTRGLSKTWFVQGGGEDSTLEDSSSSILMIDSSAEEPAVTDEEWKAVVLKTDKVPVPVHVWRQILSCILAVVIPARNYEKGVDVLSGRLLWHWKHGQRNMVHWAVQLACISVFNMQQEWILEPNLFCIPD